MFYFQQDALSYGKKYSVSSQRKHLENKWKRSNILTLCLTWTLAWVGWKGCALWKQCSREDKIIWRNVTWDFNVEEKAMPQSSVSFLEMFPYDVKGEAELSPKVVESKRKYFLNEKGSAFLKFSFTGLISSCFYVNQLWVPNSKSSISKKFYLIRNICLFFNNKVLQMLNILAKSYLIQHYTTQWNHSKSGKYEIYKLPLAKTKKRNSLSLNRGYVLSQRICF